MTGLLDGKRILIAGVLTEASLGFATAKAVAEPTRPCSVPSPIPPLPATVT